MRFFTTILTVALLPVIALAQSISGKVVDDQNEAISFANVILLSDSTYVNGIVTDDRGLFKFQPAPKNVNNIKIVVVGFEDYIAPIPPDGNFNTIALKPSSLLLNEVVVNANLPTTQLKAGALVTKVEGTILEKAGTAKDMLTRLPLVTRKGDNLEVFGRGTPIVYINGRLVRDNNELEQLNADNIKSVEVITNPGARYAADVSSVIRIRTKRPKGEGFGIDFSSQNNFNHYFNAAEIAKFAYNRKGLEIFGMVAFYAGKYYSKSTANQTTFNDTIWQQFSDELRTGKYHSLYGKLGFNYMINDRHSFGAYYQIGTGPGDEYISGSSTVTQNGSPYDNWTISSHNDKRNWPDQIGNIYYNGTFGDLQIDFNADYKSDYKQEDRTQIDNSENFDNRDMTLLNISDTRLLAEKLVLTYPVWKGSIEIGEEFTYTRSEYTNNYSGISIPSSVNEVRESNIATFAQLQQVFGPVQMALGLRYEHVKNHPYADGQLLTEQSRTYDNLFPSLSLSTRIKNVSLSLNFANKASRPYYYQLDNSLEYINRSTYQKGNPFLKPTNSYDWQLQAMWRYFFAQTTVAYQKDAIFNTSEPVADDPNARIITFVNIPNYTRMMFAIGAQPQIGCWSPNITTGFLRQWYTGEFRGEEIKFNKPVFLLNMNNTLELPYGFTVNLDYQLTSAGRMQNCFIRPGHSLRFGIRKSFLNDKLTLDLQANNLLERQDVRPTMYIGNYSITSYNPDQRYFRLTLRYKFNITNSKYRGTGAGNAEKNRM